MLTEREAQIVAIVTDTIIEKLAEGPNLKQQAYGAYQKLRGEGPNVSAGPAAARKALGYLGRAAEGAKKDIDRRGGEFNQRVIEDHDAELREMGSRIGTALKGVGQRAAAPFVHGVAAGRATTTAREALSKSQWPSPYRLVD